MFQNVEAADFLGWNLADCLVEKKSNELPGSQLKTEEAAEVDKTHNMESHDVKKEPEDVALLESLKDIKNDNYVGDDVKNKQVPPIVKVEYGQSVSPEETVPDKNDESVLSKTDDNTKTT